MLVCGGIGHMAYEIAHFFLLHGSAWHGYQLCVRKYNLLFSLIRHFPCSFSYLDLVIVVFRRQHYCLPGKNAGNAPLLRKARPVKKH